MKYLFMLFGLIAAFLYLWGMRSNRPRVALIGIACIVLEFAILTAVLLYAHSYILASAFGFSTLYVLSGLVKPSKKDS